MRCWWATARLRGRHALVKQFELIDRIIKFGGELTFPESVNKKAQDFIRCCMVRAPEQRKNARQLLEHPFIAMIDEAHYANFTTQVSRMHLLNSRMNVPKKVSSERVFVKARSRDVTASEDKGLRS